MKSIIFSIFVFALSGEALAGSTYVGQVKVLCSVGTGHCNVYTIGTAANPPACATNPKYYVFKMANPLWKEQFAIAMTAQVSNRNVTIQGDGTCFTRGSFHEDIADITLE